MWKNLAYLDNYKATHKLLELVTKYFLRETGSKSLGTTELRKLHFRDIRLRKIFYRNPFISYALTL